MLYFKNNDLAEAHHVSLRTVLNWIEAAKNGKLDLLLHEHNGKHYVANTTRNIATIEAFVEERRKYRNTKSFKILQPKPEFYKLYNESQILDIVSSLDVYKEIPLQYTYFDGGAADWDAYVNRLDKETEPNLLNRTRKLLELNDDYLKSLLQNYRKVNIVDLGVGNALPAKELIQNLLDNSLLGKYIAVDLSKDLLKIAEKNIKTWFGDKVFFESHEIDFAHTKFSDLLAYEHIKDRDVLNLILLFGHTPSNFRHPDTAFVNIHDSMGKDDILTYVLKLDTPNSRQYFDFNNDPNGARLAVSDRLVLDLLNIDEALYGVEMGYDPEEKQRYIRVRFKVALSIKFKFDAGERVIDFHKDDTLLLWRAWHQSAIDVINQLDRNVFQLLQTSQTEDKEYMLAISKIKY